MQSSFLTLLFCCLMAIPSMGQKKSSLLHWKHDKALKWADFKGRPDATDVVHAAVTYAGIDVSVENVELLTGITTFNARAVFDQYQSWVHPSRKDQRILAHEQLHFDITEVYARKLQKKLNSSKIRKHDKQRIKELKQIYTQAQLATQSRFDEETLHGLNSEREEEWRIKIHQELKSTGPELHILPEQEASKKMVVRK